MKLAEALQERADLNKKIEQLRSRITSNALMQEGVLPVEDPEQLLKELDECLNQLEKLIIVINKTIWQLYQTVNCCQICLQSVMF